MRNDLVEAELASQDAGRSNDARRDWAEIRTKAAARLDGASDILDMVRALARGC